MGVEFSEMADKKMWKDLVKQYLIRRIYTQTLAN